MVKIDQSALQNALQQAYQNKNKTNTGQKSGAVNSNADLPNQSPTGLMTSTPGMKSLDSKKEKTSFWGKAKNIYTNIIVDNASDFAYSLMKYSNPLMANTIKSIPKKEKSGQIAPYTTLPSEPSILEKGAFSVVKSIGQKSAQIAAGASLAGAQSSPALSKKLGIEKGAIDLKEGGVGEKIFGVDKLQLYSADPGATEARSVKDTALDALDVGFFATPGKRAVESTVSKFAQKFVNANTAQKVAKGASNVGRGMTGAGLGATLELLDEDSTAEDVIEKAGQFGIAAMFGPKVGNILLRGLKSGTSKGVQIASPQIRKAFNYLEDYAQSPGTKRQLRGVFDEVKEDLVFEKSVGQKVATNVVNMTRSAKLLSSQFVDRFASFNRSKKSLETFLGRELLDEEDFYIKARLAIPSIRERTSFISSDMAKIFENLEKRRAGLSKETSLYLTKLDELNRVRGGKTVTGGRTEDELIDIVDRMTTDLGDDLEYVEEARKFVQETNLSLLDEMRDVGLLSSDEVTALVKSNPDYIPHKVMADLVEDTSNRMGLSGSLNVSDNTIKKAVGSERVLQDPFLSLQTRTNAMIAAIEKNRVMRSFVDTAEQFKEVFPQVKKLGDGDAISDMAVKDAGLAKINVFRGGKKETFLVPKEIEIATKNLEAKELSRMVRILGAPSQLLRQLATGKNPSFFLPNVARDVQTGILNAEDGLMVDGFLNGMFRHNPKLLREAAENGAVSGASLYKHDEKVFASHIEKVDGTIWNKLKKAGKADVLEEVAERMENATRFSVYHKALANGASKQKAAFLARETTVDFAKMGTFMREINYVIPFLNARLQGTIQTAKSFMKNPERYLQAQFWTAVYPQTRLYAYNRQFESYQNIPPYITDNYWVIMIGEAESVDDAGRTIKVPQFVTIPKGEGQKMVANPVEFYLKKSDQINSRETGEMIFQTLTSISPVTFGSFSATDLASGIAASTGPIPRIVAGEVGNIDPFTGIPIVPQSRVDASDPSLQYKQTTTETAKDIAKIFNMSPAKFEFYLDSFGGLPKDMLRLTDIIRSDVETQTISNTDFGKAAQTPVLRSFVRENTASYSASNEQLKEIVEEYAGTIADERIRKDIQKQKIIEDIIKKPPEARATRWMQLVSQGVINKDNAKDIKKEMTDNISYTESQLKRLGVESWGRAFAIKDYLSTLKTDEEKKEKWKEYIDKKIITEQVAKQLKILYQSE